jgi:uncharacterized membrane protein
MVIGDDDTDFHGMISLLFFIAVPAPAAGALHFPAFFGPLP